MSNQLLTIHIHKDRIEVAVMSHSRRDIKIEFTRTLPVDDGTLVPQHLENSLKTVLEQAPPFDICIVAIPSDFFLFRPLSFPFKAKHKIRQTLGFELENHLPLSQDQLQTEFQILSTRSKTSTGQTPVNTLSMDLDHQEHLSTLFNACDISPDLLTLGDGYPSATLFTHGHKQNEPVLFLYRDTHVTGFYLIRNGDILTMRHMAPSPAPTLGQIVATTCLTFNEQLPSQDTITSLIVSAPMEKEERRALEEFCGLPVEVFQPPDLKDGNQKENPPHEPVRDALILGLCESCGIPMFNFQHRTSKSLFFFQAHKVNLAITATLLFLFLTATASVPLLKIQTQAAQIKLLNQKIEQLFRTQFPDPTPMVDPVHQMRIKLKELNSGLEGSHASPSLLNIDILMQISQTLSPNLDIIFNRLTRTENQLMITGSADQFNTVDKMKTQFMTIPEFKDVEIHSAAMDKLEKRVKFNIKIEL